MPTILFICTANQFRSPLAAAYLRIKLPTEIAATYSVISAGTWTFDESPIPPITHQIAKQYGLRGLENVRSKQVTKEMLNEANLIIVMETHHKEALASEFPEASPRIFLLSSLIEGLDYDIPDPAKSTVSPIEVATELMRMIDKGMGKIVSLAKSFDTKKDC